jgi:chemotaxis protein methyltransferase CheR
MPLEPTDFDFIRALVRQRSAIVLERDKLYLAEARLGPLARQMGFSSLGAFVAHLRAGADDAVERRVVESMATAETSFFRDIHPFEALRRVVFPEVIARQTATRTINLWCGACSSGQEPYSVAMLIREHFPLLRDRRVQIVACDLSLEMLDRARRGRYGQMEVNRGLPARLLVKYFDKSGADWQIKDEIRRMVEFRQINLTERWPSFPPADVVLLRNMLIYFDVETKKRVLSSAFNVLRPGGYLFLGGAETTMNLDERFERIQFERTAFYRRPSKVVGPQPCVAP